MNDAVQMKPTPLTEAEWNFSEVPDTEWIACCLWEYARESPTLLNALDYRLRREGRTAVWELTPAAKASLRSTLDLPSDQRSRLYNLLTVFDGRPWAALSSDQRQQYGKLLSSEVTPLRLANLSEVEALLKANRDIPPAVIAQLVKRGIPKARFAGNGCRQAPLASVQPLPLGSLGKLADSDWTKGCSVVAFTVDFAHYHDHELAVAFASLLARHRPPQFARPRRSAIFAKGRGKKHRDWRTALVRLGILRALHVCSFADNRFPKAFKARGDKACYFARQAALKTFRNLFPSLPKNEKPIHWATKGTTARSAEKAANLVRTK